MRGDAGVRVPYRSAMMRTWTLGPMALLVVACGGANAGQSHVSEATEASAEGDWAVHDRWPGWTQVNVERWRSPTHGNTWVDVYVNDVGADAYAAGRLADVPVGTVIVKAQYRQPGDATPYTAMVRVEEGSDDSEAGWWFGRVSPTGELLASGTPSACVSCHRDAPQNMLFGVPEGNRR